MGRVHVPGGYLSYITDDRAPTRSSNSDDQSQVTSSKTEVSTSESYQSQSIQLSTFRIRSIIDSTIINRVEFSDQISSQSQGTCDDLEKSLAPIKFSTTSVQAGIWSSYLTRPLFNATVSNCKRLGWLMRGQLLTQRITLCLNRISVGTIVWQAKLVLGEVHQIRNTDTQTYKTMESLQAEFNLLMSATPSFNQLDDAKGIAPNISGWTVGGPVVPAVHWTRSYVAQRTQGAFR